MTWFEYTFENTDADVTFCYYAYIYKSHDAFWLVQFAVAEDTAAEYEPLINQWAQSVTFPQS